MSKVIEAIKKIYPEINGGFVYWETKYCGTPWDHPSEGLIWENETFPKPSWEQIESNIYKTEIEEAKLKKKNEINALRDARMAKDVFHKVNGKDYYFQRNITANLAWINYLESSNDIAVTNWVTADNKIIDINQTDLISICAHIRDRDTQAVVQARRAKDALEKLTTLKEIEDFDINQVFVI